MDYPHPYVTLENGKVDFSQAYAVGIGEWDKRTIMYGYSDFPEGTDEHKALNDILDENTRLGLKYISHRNPRLRTGKSAGSRLSHAPLPGGGGG